MKSPYYLSCNGLYGCGPYARPDYPTLNAFLDAMDRLGVGQSVLSHTESRDLHPVYGNRRLTQELAASHRAQGRIIPAFGANPSMSVGVGEMEHLIECIRQFPACCVALFPKTNRYRLIEISRILEALRPHRPVILIDVTEMDTVVDLEDLVALAGRFPTLSFVVRKVMWWQFSRVFDVMSRTQNVYVDTSWLHTRDSIKMVCRHISPKRAVFGLGSKSHSAAAIAGLAYGDISQAERDAIAYDNFAALFSGDAARDWLYSARKPLDSHIKNGFWEDFILGKGVRGTPVVDAHTHIGPFARSWYLEHNEIKDQIEALERDMRAFGYTRIISNPETALFGQPVEGNRVVEDALIGREDRFSGNLVFNPFYFESYTPALLDEFFGRKYFVGFKLLPEYLGVPIDDPRYAPALSYANAHRLPILLHTWEGKCGTAQMVAEVAKGYPDATFILGHTGGGTQGRRQCEAIAQDPAYDNCMFEFCGSFTTEIEWTDTLEKIDYHRVLFGTDTIVHDVAWELGRLLSFDIPDEQLKAILGLNMLRILGRRR